MIRYVAAYPRPWGLDIMAMLLFALTAGILLVTLGTRSEVEAAPNPVHSATHQHIRLKAAPAQQPAAAATQPVTAETKPEVDPFLPPNPSRQEIKPPAAAVSVESQQKILKIINGEP